MVSDTASMEILTTHTEAEALLLEANLIKKLKPRYNILLRDDKSYPWLMLTEDHPFPQIAKHRGAQTAQGQLLGAVRLGLVGEPDGPGFAARFSAAHLRGHGLRQPHPPLPALPDQALLRPLRGRVSEAEYQMLVDQAKSFLSGKSSAVQKDLGRRDGGGRQ